MSNEKGKCIGRLKSGNIILSVWKNDAINKNGESVSLFNFVISRVYFHDGKSLYTQNFRLMDLSDIQKVIDNYRLSRLPKGSPFASGYLFSEYDSKEQKDTNT